MELLTSSRASSFRACPRKHYYAYTLGWRTCREPAARWFGTCLHKGWEGYWRARKAGVLGADRLAAALQALPTGMEPFDYAKATAILTVYTSIWDRFECRVISVETQFRLPLLNPETGYPSTIWQRGGKLDVLVELPDGRIAVIEHKSTSEDASPGSAYRQRLVMDGQVSEYFDGGDSKDVRLKLTSNRAVSVLIYDIVTKPRIKPLVATPVEERKYTQAKSRVCPECKKKNAAPAPHTTVVLDEESGYETRYQCVEGRIVTDPGGRLYANMRDTDETPDEYADRCVEVMLAEVDRHFQRAEIVRLQNQRNEHQLDTWHTAHDIRRSELTHAAPRNPGSCFRFGSPCDYWPVCTGETTIENGELYRKLGQVHEELEEREA